MALLDIIGLLVLVAFTEAALGSVDRWAGLLLALHFLWAPSPPAFRSLDGAGIR